MVKKSTSLHHEPATQVGLLGELPRRGHDELLVRDVPQPGGRLPELGAHRVPVLREQQHAVVVVERDHRDGTRVRDVLAEHLRVPEVHHVTDEVEDLPRVDDLVRHDRTRRLEVGEHQDSSPRWARAASMSPANSGCARVGRDLNSGCACVDT